MIRQTNRRRCLSLLAAPLLASSVALTPAFAAQGRAAGPGAAPSAPSCELVPGGGGKPGVTCAKPLPQKPGGGKGSVKVTKAEVVVLTPPGSVIDCSKGTTAEFDGKITATGPGKVRYYWTFASSSDPVSPGSADFAAGTGSRAVLHVVKVPGQANASTVSTFVTLHLPDQKMSARSAQVTFTCEKK
ncbi:hypothetical protein [Streptomyces sp. H27-S2]|uniref:hypothetical protein n=1 Tax=Streptomyces antarcticus TaxID=2996458 RepID=UPI00226DEBE5|nr:hypothetical protein [Streptomyces sp. H27-S2]MCY0950123.1 hypothetical protein [Streptomyces sp. H27-S2]